MTFPPPDLSFEQNLAANGPICGVDEVGRGPWAGPVMAAAVILRGPLPEGLTDSKKLSAKKREIIAAQLRETCIFAVAEASVAEIDQLNIRQATFLAMCRAVAALPVAPAHALIDGRDVPKDLPCPGTALIRGDGRSLSIAAASVIAKVARDQVMKRLDAAFPGYGWAQNAGYGTKQHQEGLKIWGVTPHHRRSFKPIHKMLCEEHSLSD